MTDIVPDVLISEEQIQKRVAELAARLSSDYADVDDLMRDVDFKPATPIEEGIANFVRWYREYYSV